MTEEIKGAQKEVSEIVTLVSGSRESINSAIELKKQYPQSRVDLLHVTGVNWNHADSFPVDIMYMLNRIAPGVGDCYTCDAGIVRKYINDDPYFKARRYLCERCQLSLAIVLSQFIAEKGYAKLLYCGPDQCEKLWRSVASVIIGPHQILKWDYPILDYGIESYMIHKDCSPIFYPALYMEDPFESSEVKRLCYELVDKGILTSLYYEKIEYEDMPF